MTENTQNTQTAQEAQLAYESLLEEQSAFRQAGMHAKVEEWDFKIKSLEMAQKYTKIDFKYIADEFGIEGLSEAVADKHIADEEKMQEYCGKLWGKTRLSETALYSFVDDNDWKWGKDPEITKQVMQFLAPKLASIHARKQFALIYKLDSIQPQVKQMKQAFIKVEKISDYMQNDNPPNAELLKVVEANVSNLFHCLYIAFPMVGHVKQIDPIIFGILKDPTKDYDSLDGNKVYTESFGFQANDELTANNMNQINIGDMYQVAQWV